MATNSTLYMINVDTSQLFPDIKPSIMINVTPDITTVRDFKFSILYNFINRSTSLENLVINILGIKDEDLIENVDKIKLTFNHSELDNDKFITRDLINESRKSAGAFKAFLSRDARPPHGGAKKKKKSLLKRCSAKTKLGKRCKNKTSNRKCKLHR